MQLAAGAGATFLQLRPQSARLRLRVRHLYLVHASTPVAGTVKGLLRTNIPGLEDLNGLQVFATGGLSSSGLILPVFHDLRGDAGGELAVDNLTGVALFISAGMDGYYMEDERDESILRPALESPSFVRSSPVINVGSTTDTELLHFQTPNYRGGIVLTGFLPVCQAFSRTTFTFQGAGLEMVGPLNVQHSALYPICAWLPPLSMVRVLGRRAVASTNIAIALFGHGLP